MANTDTPMGFRPIANLTGGDGSLRAMSHPAADGTAIGKWDFVNITGAADVVEQYDNNDPVRGVSLSYVAASTLGQVDVHHINHTTVMECQEDSVGGAIAAASEGLNCQVIVAAANTTTGISAMEADSSTVATTTTLALRLLQPSPRIGNTVASAYCKWYVTALELDIAEAKAGT